MFNLRVFSIVSAILVLAGLVHATTFQHGNNGWYGGEDTSISEATWGAGPYSRGGDDLARAGGTPGTSGDLNQALVQFNDIFGTASNQFNPNWKVTSATLYLQAKTTYNSTGTTVMQAWPMMSDWAEGTSASWAIEHGASCGNYRYTQTDGTWETGDYWGTAGVVETGPVWGVDYNVDGANQTRATAPMNPSGSTGWFTIDVTDIVKAWKNGDYANNGFYLYTGSTWDYLDFYTKECSVVGYRPALVIVPEPASMSILLIGLTFLIKRCKA